MPLIEPTSVKPLDTNTKNYNTIFNNSEAKSTEYHTKFDTQSTPQKEAPIRIIDNKPENIQPCNSADIIKRIKEVTSQDIKVDFLYTLPQGGIAIHLQSKEDIRKLEEQIENIYPSSSCSIPLSQQNKERVVAKNINPKISTEAIKIYIYRTTNQNIEARRFFSSINLNPLPIISITCEKKYTQTLINSSVV